MGRLVGIKNFMQLFARADLPCPGESAHESKAWLFAPPGQVQSSGTGPARDCWSPLRNQRGLGLLEVLASSAILMIGMMALLDMQVFASKNAKKTGDKLSATNDGLIVAQKELQAVQADLVIAEAKSNNLETKTLVYLAANEMSGMVMSGACDSGSMTFIRNHPETDDAMFDGDKSIVSLTAKLPAALVFAEDLLVGKIMRKLGAGDPDGLSPIIFDNEKHNHFGNLPVITQYVHFTATQPAKYVKDSDRLYSLSGYFSVRLKDAQNVLTNLPGGSLPYVYGTLYFKDVTPEGAAKTYLKFQSCGPI